MEHEEGCKYAVNTSNVQTEGPLESLCSSRKCSVWLDLKTWFGYKSKSLSNEMFNEYFLDVAHGGNGSYEKLILSANKAIVDCIQEDLLNCQDVISLQVLSRQLFPNMPHQISYELVLYFWCQKHSEIATTDTSLAIFVNSYLHGGQKLISNRAKASYVKVLFSFSYQSIAGEHHHEHVMAWVPCFLQHITTAHKHVHLGSELENQLLLDLETYLNYKYDYITPRIHECLSLPFDKVASLSDIDMGRDMLKLSCRLYFDAVEMLKSHGHMDKIDLNEQVELLLGSGSLEVMSSIYMNLHKITSHNLSIIGGEVEIAQAKSIFERLVGACCCTIKKDSLTLCDTEATQAKQKFETMAKLVQRLHQIQMAIQFFQKQINPDDAIRQKISMGVDKSVTTVPEATSIFAGMDISNSSKSSDKPSTILGNFQALVKSYENLWPIQDAICCKMMEISMHK